MKLIAAMTLALGLATNFVQPRPALAWGDEGHEVVALIAQSFLEAGQDRGPESSGMTTVRSKRCGAACRGGQAMRSANPR
jgi:hypothetical protein